ncbi:MAG: hypothetical protein J7K31_04390 [Candidatus Aenigmarchaeota archaeon]|nr:hypothetical protein [Candidatus Aenigmarchaeota archaeon]
MPETVDFDSKIHVHRQTRHYIYGLIIILVLVLGVFAVDYVIKDSSDKEQEKNTVSVEKSGFTEEECLQLLKNNHKIDIDNLKFTKKIEEDFDVIYQDSSPATWKKATINLDGNTAELFSVSGDKFQGCQLNIISEDIIDKYYQEEYECSNKSDIEKVGFSLTPEDDYILYKTFYKLKNGKVSHRYFYLDKLFYEDVLRMKGDSIENCID